MTEKEMLELAAKAAAIDVSETLIRDDGTYVFYAPRTPNWNPLKDDGDALRLAVMRRINLNFDVLEGGEMATSAKKFMYPAFVEKHGADQDAATRRAIVRAAADIGKSISCD